MMADTTLAVFPAIPGEAVYMFCVYTVTNGSVVRFGSRRVYQKATGKLFLSR